MADVNEAIEEWNLLRERLDAIMVSKLAEGEAAREAEKEEKAKREVEAEARVDEENGMDKDYDMDEAENMNEDNNMDQDSEEVGKGEGYFHETVEAGEVIEEDVTGEA